MRLKVEAHVSLEGVAGAGVREGVDYAMNHPKIVVCTCVCVTEGIHCSFTAAGLESLLGTGNACKRRH